MAASGSFLSVRILQTTGADTAQSQEEWLRLAGRNELGDGEVRKFQAGGLCKEAGRRRAFSYLLIKGGLTAPRFLEKRDQALLTTHPSA